MAEGSSERGGLLSRAPRIGRRAASIVFWCAALFVAGAGFYSIPLQVFQPQAAASPPAEDCATGVRALKAELLARASEHVASGGDVTEGLDEWLRGWDLRHAALAPLCSGEGEAAHLAVGRMRHRVDDALGRITREISPLSRQVDQGLENTTSHQ